MRFMNKARRKTVHANIGFGQALANEDLAGLASELQQLREHPPLVRRHDGKYEGDILAFVKGLRLSARVVYFLRQRLAQTRLEVHWGHLLDESERSCSPECDVIIHSGCFRRWNGFERPVMDFAFVQAQQAKAVVSCKSKLDSIDTRYPKVLREFGVRNVLLLAECCREKDFNRLCETGRRAGYRAICCLYFTKQDGSFLRLATSELVEFTQLVFKAVTR
jgi:hypothetical protein